MTAHAITPNMYPGDEMGKSPKTDKGGDDPQNGDIMATRTPKEIAVEWDTDAKSLRKFLRSDAKVNGTETPGKGKRYAIEAKSLRSLKVRFDAWVAAKATKEEEVPEVLEDEEVLESPEVLEDDNEVIDEEIALDAEV
jgi:hypothetical protein